MATLGPGRRIAVFYNEAMSLDRDLNVAVANAWARLHPGRRSGWEMLAATGVRGLRILAESTMLSSLVLSERNPQALEVLRANARPFAERGAVVSPWDSRRAHPDGPFGYVDLDPYGSPLPFLDSALDALAPAGLLAVTATDMMVLAGVQRSACERRYGARPIRGRLGPEAGLRILLGEIERRAERRGRRLRPRLAYVHGHYVRAYVTAEPGVGSPGEVGMIDPQQWDGPPISEPGPVGPMWLGRLFDPDLLDRLEVSETSAHPASLAAWCTTFRSESAVDVPFYYESNEIARTLRLSRPPSPADVVSAIRAEGFPAAPTHARTGAFRTSAPRAIVERSARAALHRPRTA